ncbi:MAG TPA: TrmH family RNA methyltransferase, partial [Gemmatimonadaceae bacterium]|nr:TrmH family RNA methyltransferase [Gemmatimonadaceae bacterium]
MRLLTLARDLRRRKARERRGLFAAEGVRCVEELAASSLAIQGALAAPQLVEHTRGEALVARLLERGVDIESVSSAEFASAAETDSPQGVLAIASIPDRTLDGFIESESLRLLVLDAVQDPGNVGTIVRTAAALGATATVALPGTVDLWNAKVVRSAMGAHFTHLAMPATWDTLDAFRARRPLALWGASGDGIPLATGTDAAPGRLAIVVGNEGAGLST